MKLIPDLDKGCSDYLSKTMSNLDVSKLVKADPFTIPAWRKVLSYNDPANFASPSAAPLLMIQGGNDEQIPVASTKLLADHLCKIGQNLERWIYPGQALLVAAALALPAYVLARGLTNRLASRGSNAHRRPTGT